MSGSLRSGAPAGLWLEAAHAALRRQARVEWFGSPPHLLSISGPRADGFAAFPHDIRPVRPEVGAAILAGNYLLAGQGMSVGRGGDPWNRPSPSRAFAEALHRFGWLKHLLAVGEDGAREALRLIEDWRLTFGHWSSFAWGGHTLERRVLNLSCALEPLCAIASEAEVETLANLIARQARQLMILRDPAWRRTERAVAAGVAAAALSGPASEQLLARTRGRINRALAHAVLPDGGHASRSPETGLELLLDLLALDDGLAKRGMQAPEEAARAIDRLTAALRFFTLPDGRLACFQGGEESDPARIAAARARDQDPRDDPAAPPPVHAPHSGYQRLTGKSIQVICDVGVPAHAPWSVSACAQPGAIEVVCGADRLITNSGWSLRTPMAQAQRLTDAGSTAALGHESAGEPMNGWLGQVLGPRLSRAATKVAVQRSDTDDGRWLVFSHNGWAARLGLIHERRIYLGLEADELRGEDRFSPTGPDQGQRLVPYVIHFHLTPESEAVVARDNKSVLIRGASDKGWWLRNDATEVRVEPAAHYRDGRQLASTQVLLMGHIRADKGGRVRWKLTAVE
jgi:uncharacterized heparinase superfamily protein